MTDANLGWSAAAAPHALRIVTSTDRPAPVRTAGRVPVPAPMAGPRTTAAVQHYLDSIAGDARAETMVRELLDRAVQRLHLLCCKLLHRSYPRLARPPVNLCPDELLSAVVVRLLMALRAVRPANVRQFFALANKHMRWELNGLARRMDAQPRADEIDDSAVMAPASSGGGLSFNTVRMLEAIDLLPDDEREVFQLLRIQGLTHGEVADLLGVSTKTVQRRLQRSLLLLAEALDDLRPRAPDGP